MIVCGGLATRLLPVSEKIPKSMVSICGKPLLYYQLALLKKQGIKDIILCVGHLSEKIEEYFGTGEGLGVDLRYSFESTLLGTAGAVKNIDPSILEDDFIVMYGDILSDLDMGVFFGYHKEKNSYATILVREKKSRGSSLIDIDRQHKIIGFVERPTDSFLKNHVGIGKMNLVNSGIFVLKKEVLKTITLYKKSDFSYDVFPELIMNNKTLVGFPLPKSTYWKEAGN
ncbi:MAG: nucleotidyltransferase family protein, partial [Nanoarchaeota archaeon]|nr:nucleotidyltransferase family protein [Nanoarchaeota archaeon]